MVTGHYLRLHHHNTVADPITFARRHEVVVLAVDNVPWAGRLETAELPRTCLPAAVRAGRPGGVRCRARRRGVVGPTAQFGSTRSINAGVAAGVAMHG